MSGEFLDSNVLVYLFDNVNEGKQSKAVEIVDAALADGGVISFQVVQETINSLLKMDFASVPETERLLDSVLRRLWRVMPSTELYRRALSLRARYQFTFYDSLIIAAAIEAGCDRLYTEDLQHGQRIEGLTIVNPFANVAST